MIEIKTHKGEVCWWCGKSANSREHRHKKSDIKLLFGNKFCGEPILLKDNQQKKLQGPNSDLLKFERVLCQNCNNSRSQPFDRAYDCFINYTLNNYDKLLNDRIINFNEIDKTNTKQIKNDIFRYFTKIFCCRLASNNISIKTDLIDFLNSEKQINYLYFKFEIRPDIYTFLNRDNKIQNEGNIYLSPLKYYLRDEDKKIGLVYQFYNLQWLRIYTFYSNDLIDSNYNGYDDYYNSDSMKIEVKYTIHPDLIFKAKIHDEQKINEYDWLDNYLDKDTFKEN